MSGRRGISLIEALVALFLAAGGLIAILALFPVGAVQMGQALKDGRCAQAAQQADGLIRHYWAKYERPGAASPIVRALYEGDSGQRIPDGDPSPSYPVWIDPIGYKIPWNGTSGMSAQSTAVGGARFLPRRTLTEPNFNAPGVYTNLLRNDGMLYRMTMLQDDITYVKGAGTPATNVERGGRYTWAWQIQRPQNSNPSTMDLTVIVFDGRPPYFSAPDTEVLYRTQYNPGTKTVQFVEASLRPLRVAKGRWICDVTPNADLGTTVLRHCNWYRIDSVIEERTSGGARVVTLELETPLRRNDDKTLPVMDAQFIICPGVAEVFPRPPLKFER